MAKSTHAQEAATGTSDSYTAHEASDVDQPVRIQRAVLGVPPAETERGDEKSVGNSGSQSAENPSKVTDNSNPLRPEDAPVVENPSKTEDSNPEGPSDVRSTGGPRKTATPSARKSTPRTKKDEFDF